MKRTGCPSFPAVSVVLLPWRAGFPGAEEHHLWVFRRTLKRERTTKHSRVPEKGLKAEAGTLSLF